MKIVFFIPLLLLACAFSAMVTAPPVVPTATWAVSLSPTASSAMCARVIAVESVNVRDDKNDVIGHLYYGDVVTLSDGVGDWWIVTGSVSGRVRSTYLKVVDCDKR